MSTWVVQVVVVVLFALTCGVLAAAWMRGRLGTAAIALFVGALVVWVVVFAAIVSEFRDANGFATCDADCSPCTTSPRSRSSRRRCSSRWRRSRCSSRAGTAGDSGGRRRRRHARLVASSFKLPDLGEGLTEGEVARWLVTEGQEIAEDDPLVEIQTDKATVEIPSPYAGTVLRILVAEGEIAPVGTELVVIGQPGEGFPSSVSTTAAVRCRKPPPLPARRASAGAGDAGRSPDRAGARRRSGRRRGLGAGRPDHGGRRARGRRGRHRRVAASRSAAFAA